MKHFLIYNTKDGLRSKIEPYRGIADYPPTRMNRALKVVWKLSGVQTNELPLTSPDVIYREYCLTHRDHRNNYVITYYQEV